jgi:hypothetical protein
VPRDLTREVYDPVVNENYFVPEGGDRALYTTVASERRDVNSDALLATGWDGNVDVHLIETLAYDANFEHEANDPARGAFGPPGPDEEKFYTFAYYLWARRRQRRALTASYRWEWGDDREPLYVEPGPSITYSTETYTGLTTVARANERITEFVTERSVECEYLELLVAVDTGAQALIFFQYVPTEAASVGVHTRTWRLEFQGDTFSGFRTEEFPSRQQALDAMEGHNVDIDTGILLWPAEVPPYDVEAVPDNERQTAVDVYMRVVSPAGDFRVKISGETQIHLNPMQVQELFRTVLGTVGDTAHTYHTWTNTQDRLAPMAPVYRIPRVSGTALIPFVSGERTYAWWHGVAEAPIKVYLGSLSAAPLEGGGFANQSGVRDMAAEVLNHYSPAASGTIVCVGFVSDSD